jgi:hypothetical protein
LLKEKGSVLVVRQRKRIFFPHKEWVYRKYMRECWLVRRRVKKECIDTIIGKSYVGDWFLFYLLGQNIDSVIFKVRLSPPTFRLVTSRVRICKLLWRSGIVAWRNRFLVIDFYAGIFEQSMVARNQVGIGFSNRSPYF